MSVDSINVPSTLAKKTLSGPLRLVTICSDDIEVIKNFYERQLSLVVDGPIEVPDTDKLKNYYGISDDIDFAIYKVGVGNKDNDVRLRVINISQSTPSIKGSHSAREVGLLMMDRLADSKNGLSQSPDQYYWSASNEKGSDQEESLDFVDTLSPMITFVTDQVDEDVTFFTHIMGMLVIEDATTKVSPKELPGLEKATEVRSIHLQAMTGDGCTIRLLSFVDGQYLEQEAAPRLPNQGVTMCSFETTDIGEILARAHAKQIKVYRTPRKLSDPLLGEIITMSLLSPTGSIIEVYSRA